MLEQHEVQWYVVMQREYQLTQDIIKPHSSIRLAISSPFVPGVWAEGNPLASEQLRLLLASLRQNNGPLREVGLDPSQVSLSSLCCLCLLLHSFYVNCVNLPMHV